MRTELRGFNPDESEIEQDVDVEEVIGEMEVKYADFIKDDTQGQFDAIFEAARRSYAEPEAQKAWDQLFENLRTELEGAADEDEIASILLNYVKKANALG